MKIKGLSGVFANQQFDLNGPMYFGRNSASCGVLFPDDTKGVSRMHCKIELTPYGVMITDLGSSYGTYVNGLRIQQHVDTPLKPGDSFYLGDQSNMFSLEAEEAAPAVKAKSSVSTWGYVGYLSLMMIPMISFVVSGIAMAIVFNASALSIMFNFTPVLVVSLIIAGFGVTMSLILAFGNSGKDQVKKLARGALIVYIFGALGGLIFGIIVKNTLVTPLEQMLSTYSSGVGSIMDGLGSALGGLGSALGGLF